MKKMIYKELSLKYESIYQKYADDVYRVSLYLTKHSNRAKHITQQAFQNLFDEFEKVDEQYVFGYLVHNVKTLAKDFMQEKSNIKEVKKDD